MKKTRKTTRKPIFWIALACILFLGGTVLIIRGIFIDGEAQNVQDTLQLNNQGTKFNNPTRLQRFDRAEISTNFIFSDGISQSFYTPQEELWLAIETDGEVVVGLVTNEAFQEQLILPKDAEFITVYDNGNLLFLEDNELWGISLEGEVTRVSNDINNASSIQEIIYSQELALFLILTENNITGINSQGNISFQLEFETEVLREAQLWNITEETIEVISQRACYDAQITTRQLMEKECIELSTSRGDLFVQQADVIDLDNNTLLYSAALLPRNALLIDNIAQLRLSPSDFVVVSEDEIETISFESEPEFIVLHNNSFFVQYENTLYQYEREGLSVSAPQTLVSFPNSRGNILFTADAIRSIQILQGVAIK